MKDWFDSCDSSGKTNAYGTCEGRNFCKRTSTAEQLSDKKPKSRLQIGAAQVVVV